MLGKDISLLNMLIGHYHFLTLHLILYNEIQSFIYGALQSKKLINLVLVLAMLLFFDISQESSEHKVLQPCDILYSRAKLLPISDRLDAFRSNF